MVDVFLENGHILFKKNTCIYADITSLNQCKLNITKGAVKIHNTSQSVSPTTGSLITCGGIGIKKDLHIGGQLYVQDHAIFNNDVIVGLTTTDCLTVNSKTTFRSNVNICENLTIDGDLNMSTNFISSGECIVLNNKPETNRNGSIIYGVHRDIIKDSGADFACDAVKAYDPCNWKVQFHTTDSRNFENWYIRIISGEANNEIRNIIAYDIITKTATINGHFTGFIVPNDLYVLYDNTNLNCQKIISYSTKSITITNLYNINYTNWYMLVLSGNSVGILVFVKDSSTSLNTYVLEDDIDVSAHDKVIFINNDQYKAIVFSGKKNAFSFVNVVDIINKDNSGTKDFVDICAGNITLDGNITAESICTMSDKRLKENINKITIETAFDKVIRLNPVTFNWLNKSQTNYGLIAQEVEKVLPCLVTTNKQGMKSIQYDKLTPILITIIQDLIKRVQYLELNANC